VSTTVTFPRVVAAGAAFTCGVAGTGRAYCWGDDTLGQLGDGKLVGTSIPRLVTTAVSFTDLTAGGAHGCGLTSIGTAFCWGFDRYGQLGNEQYLYNSSTPISVDGELRFRSISAGFFHTCAATTDGRAFCWGANNFGQIANARVTRIVTDSIKTAGGRDTIVTIDSVAVTETPQQISLPAGIQSVIASRGGHSCALGADGTAYCWGSNGNGELGLGTSTPPNRTPQVVQTALRFTQLAAGSGFTCGQSGDAIYCWGRNDLGQLGARGTSLTPRQIGQPVSIDPATGVATAQNVQFVGVTAGTRHACGLTRTGAVYCWGSDYLGALGAGQQAMVQYRPVLVRVPPEFADQP
jgi:alpha-tubulin suppressor-like RCC1 family protein